jgi:hypothetical protein
LGATVSWDNQTQTVTAKKGDTTVSLKIDSLNTTVNRRDVVIDVPPQLIDAKTFVPVRFVSESLGAEVEWNEPERMAIIKTPSKEIYLGTHYYFTIDGQSFVYEGEVANGLPNGFGVAVSGTTVYGNVLFEGQWKDGHLLKEENNNQQSTIAESKPNTSQSELNPKQDKLYAKGNSIRDISESDMSILEWYDGSKVGVQGLKDKTEYQYQQAIAKYGKTSAVESYFSEQRKGNLAVEYAMHRIYEEAVGSGNVNSRFNGQILQQRLRSYMDEYLSSNP